MLSRKNIFLNLLLGIMMLSLTAYGDSKNSMPEKSTIKTPNTQKPDTKVTLTWQDNIKTAFELAQKEQKNVMVMVEDVRCRWCIKMKEGALSNAEVQKNLQKYILLKIDRGDNKSMESLPGLRGPIPSFHFFTAKKKSIDKIAGYYETEVFLGYIKEIAEDEL
jgi:thioredoxin-related protein